MAAVAQFEASCRSLRPSANLHFTGCLRQETLARTVSLSPALQIRRPSRQLGALYGRPIDSCRYLSTTPACHARLISRPKRPYQFTQIVQLSDGSTFTTRTTSPHALLKCSKDSRNNALWQPSDKSLRNVEVDEAGKLAAFRNRFGRGWDAESTGDTEDTDAKDKKGANATKTVTAEDSRDPFDALSDLLSGYAAKAAPQNTGGGSAKEMAKSQKKK